jgi:hypothetical protein
MRKAKESIDAQVEHYGTPVGMARVCHYGCNVGLCGLTLANMRLFLLVLIVFILVRPTNAAGPDGTYAAIGSGGASCGTWTSERRAQQARVMQQWVLGFLSGIGHAVSGADPLNRTDAQEVWAWIDNYCHTNPIKNVASASEAFYKAYPR